MQNRTDIEPIQQVTEQHIAENKEEEGRADGNSALLIHCDNIDTVEKQAYLKKLLS